MYEFAVLLLMNMHVVSFLKLWRINVRLDWAETGTKQESNLY